MKVYVATTNKGALNLREKPDKSSRILTQIPYKASLEVEDLNNEWVPITYHGYHGYVMSQFLSDDKPISKNDLQRIYNSLKEVLQTIETVLK